MDILEPKAVTEGKLRTTVRGDLSSLGTNDWRSKRKQFDSHGTEWAEQWAA